MNRIGTLGALTIGLFLAGPTQAGSTSIQACEDCHGKAGASESAEVPNLGGVSAYYMQEAMAAYRDKARPCPQVESPKGGTTTMCTIAGDLDKAATDAVAEHFAAQPIAHMKQDTDAAKVAAGAKVHDYLCEKCHADAGGDPEDDAGIMSGQGMAWLRQEFEHYCTGERGMPDKMKQKFDKLSAKDIDALVHYYAAGGE